MIGRAKAVLFGTTPRIAGTLVLGVVVLVGGAVAAGVVGVPSVESIDNEFGDVTENRTAIHTDVTIHNPNPIGTGFADVSAAYDVSMNGVGLADGRLDVDVGPGTSTESFTTHLHNERIPDWWVTHVRNDERTEVVVDATVRSDTLNRGLDLAETRTVETDLLSAFDSDRTRPVNADRPLVDDPVLYINATRGDWGDVDERQTELDLAFDAYNPKSYPIAVTRIGYAVTMNEVAVGEGTTAREYVLEPGEETTVETSVLVENDRLDEWWVTHVENGQVTDLRIEFAAQLEVPGTGTTVDVPLDALTYEERIETDVWGEGNDAADAAGNESAGNDDPGARDGESDGGDGNSNDGNGDSTAGDGDSGDDEADSDDGLLGGGDGGDGNGSDGGLLGDLAAVPPASA